MAQDDGSQQEQQRDQGIAHSQAPLRQYQEQFVQSVGMLAREATRFQESMFELFETAQRQLTSFWGSRPSSQQSASSSPQVTTPAGEALEQAATAVEEVTEEAAAATEEVTQEAAATTEEVTGEAAGTTSADLAQDRPLEELSKEELYELAQRHEIEGRSGMNKDELLDAVARASRSLEELTKEELYELAQEHEIEGRSGMNKDQLADALRPNVPSH